MMMLFGKMHSPNTSPFGTFIFEYAKSTETMETPNERQGRLDEEKKQRLQTLFEEDVLFKTLSKHFEPTIKNITLAEPALLHPKLKGQK